MNFYYHPILGLQVTFGCGYFEIDLEALPMPDLRDWLNIFNQTGVMFCDSEKSKNTITAIPRITSNVL